MKFTYRSDLPTEKRSNHVSFGQRFDVVDGAVDVPDVLVQGRLDEMLAHGFVPWTGESTRIEAPSLDAPQWKKRK